MLIFLYLAVLIPGIYYVVKLLAPEMTKPVPSKFVKDVETDFSGNSPENRIEKLENLLAEKNKNIGLLQKELKMFHAQIRDFEKIKILLEQEILHLREQNRIFRSEFGIPAGQSKENSIT